MDEAYESVYKQCYYSYSTSHHEKSQHVGESSCFLQDEKQAHALSAHKAALSFFQQ